MDNCLRLAALAALSLLVSCGGGGDPPAAAPVSAPAPAPSPAPSPVAAAKGLWNGTLSNGRTISAIVLSDGTYYGLYSVAGNSAVIAGFLHGGGVATGNAFTSTNGRDFNYEGAGVQGFNVSATFTSRQSFNGTGSYGSGSPVTFTSTYDTAFDGTPTTSIVAGSYSGQVALSVGVQSASLTVSSAGAISGNGQGCLFTGTVVPRSDGNAYDAVISFGGSPCLYPGQTFTGAAYYNATTRILYAALPNLNGVVNSMLFVGTKQ